MDRRLIHLTYSHIFEDYEKVDVKELISDMPSRDLLELVSTFLFRLYQAGNNNEVQLEVASAWCSRLPPEVTSKINGFFNSNYLRYPNSIVYFFSLYTSLKFIELVLSNYNFLPSVRDFTPEQELRLLKAYLHCAQQWADHQDKTFLKTSDKEELLSVLLASQIPFKEYISFKDIRSQLIKAVYFYDFCEHNEQFKAFLNIFLQGRNASSWKFYLKTILDIYIRNAFNNPAFSPILVVPEEHSDVNALLRSLCVDTNSFSASPDFLALREKPLYQVDDRSYIILNMHFFVDKVFQGISFDFSKAVVNGEAVYNGKIIKSGKTFLGIYGFDFAENKLFYEVIGDAFKKNSYKRISGSKLKELGIIGEPDYYIRNGNDLFIFEFKNSLLNSSVKNSFDFDNIRSELIKKFVKDAGASQLANVIELILKGQFEKVDKLKYNKLIIYPILVYTDPSLDSQGVNYLINKEFVRLVNDRGLGELFVVKDLVMINLDFFIELQEELNFRRVTLKNCLEGYLKEVQKKGGIGFLQSFQNYIDNLPWMQNLNFPKSIKIKVQRILQV